VKKVTRIEKLTKEQEAMFPVWRDKWIEIGLRTGETDWATFEKYMPVCFKKAGIKYPKNIVRVSSPLVGGLAAAISERVWKNRGAVRGAVGDAVHGAVHGAVHDAVHDAVRDAVGDAVRDAVHDAVGGAVHDAVGDAVHGAVHDAVRDAVRGAVRGARLEWHYWLGGQFWVGGWWGSPSYVSFFTEVCGLKLTKDITERAKAYQRVCESVNYIWPNRNFVIACARPKSINRNVRGQLHSDTGKSIEYPDGWGLYHLNGVRFEEDLWREVVSKKMPFQDILAIKDIDQRRQAMKYGSWEEFVEFAGAKKLDEFLKFNLKGEAIIHQLWEFPLQADEEKRIFTKTVHFARYQDRSIGEWHVKGVPGFNTISEAMAWGMSDDEHKITAEEWKGLKIGADES